MRMTIALFLLLFIVQSTAHAQGGIGNMPREDLVLVSAIARDSLADEVYAKIVQLRTFAAENKIDSAGQIIAYNGAPIKDHKWARSLNLTDPIERARAQSLLDKLKKIYQDFPELHREYFAIFKNKDNPAGQMELYQIKYENGKKSRMVSYSFYPIGDVMMLGDIQ